MGKRTALGRQPTHQPLIVVTAIESQKTNVGRATNGSPVFSEETPNNHDITFLTSNNDVSKMVGILGQDESRCSPVDGFYVVCRYMSTWRTTDASRMGGISVLQETG